MGGNVWQWCSDFYDADYYKKSPAENPPGPAATSDPQTPQDIEHVQRGGSFLCTETYCDGYKAGKRGKGEVSSSSNNLGFRCARD